MDAAAALSFSPPPPLSFRKHRFASFSSSSSSTPAAAATTNTTRGSEIELENRKFELLRAVTDTKRGLTATPLQRSSIEEALVSVECFDAGKPISLGLLDGTWRLQYTSAPDVVVLFQSAATLPFLEIDQIFQKFECGGDQSSGEGVVRNIVRWSIPRVLEENEGATLLVSAKFSVVSPRNIFLEFEEVLSLFR
ncbi:hypothetical protein MIMGU_mgv1a014331mg [Erythranthe guttata]|uniref:Plastid lipid-associated protein/fibrillin conserved domain-containing protein n=1 Tax=Erythranthe guttata TaxID=4155 RepID=A0A022REE2_ERYGU|nr:hypothetical protein MIMGU_mgv1a014331mg [Erythranthe guttata]